MSLSLLLHVLVYFDVDLLRSPKFVLDYSDTICTWTTLIGLLDVIGDVMFEGFTSIAEKMLFVIKKNSM